MKLNKKGVEGLPLRYIIIALVAALVIGIALQFTGILRGGIMNAAGNINDSLTEKTTCELDEETPDITFVSGICTDDKTTITVRLTDDCGINDENVGFYANSAGGSGVWTDLVMDTNSTINNGTWTGTTVVNSTLYGLNKNVTGTIVAKDKSTAANQETEQFKLTELCD
jgi:hypothetical protein